MGNIQGCCCDKHGVYEKKMYTLPQIQEELRWRKQEATRIMKETQAEHVLYALKIFSHDRLIAIQFYMWPMSDRKFREIAGRGHGSLVYALHRG